MALSTIVHLDADAFFVSCEQARDPSLKGKICAVGGTERGIISSASYEARARGVYTPMPTRSALQVCPELIMIRHTSGLYSEVSGKMFDLCETLTPLVQRNSIDEGYLDAGPCGLRDQAAVNAAVRALQERIGRELDIPVSMGIATNKLVAQIASKLRKPRGFVVVAPGEEAAFLEPLGIGKLPGIGPKTESSLKERSLRTVGQLFQRTEAELESLFGRSWRDVLRMARGEDEGEVRVEEDDAKSYSQQETFGQDVGDFAALERVAKGMLDELMAKVRRDGKRVRTLTIKVRYPDFTQESRAQTLDTAVDVEAPFYPLIAPLLRAAWRKPRPLRLISVRLSTIDDPPSQLELFAAPDEKRRRLAQVLDTLHGAVTHGHQVGSPKVGAPLRGDRNANRPLGGAR